MEKCFAPSRSMSVPVGRTPEMRLFAAPAWDRTGVEL
jgi:hypothetical protein